MKEKTSCPPCPFWHDGSRHRHRRRRRQDGAFSERNADAFTIAGGGDPRQDDYDIWLGTGIIKPWIAAERHSGAANYLYLDGHVATLAWGDAVRDMYPDKIVLTQDGTYPY